jgi:hypothetical protein
MHVRSGGGIEGVLGQLTKPVVKPIFALRLASDLLRAVLLLCPSSAAALELMRLWRERLQEKELVRGEQLRHNFGIGNLSVDLTRTALILFLSIAYIIAQPDPLISY